MSETDNDPLFFGSPPEEFEERSIKETPTVFFKENFNKNEDAEILRRSVKGNRQIYYIN